MIALDWGTTTLRAYRLDAAGHVLAQREQPLGILSVPAGGFPAALEAIAGDWLDSEHSVLASGMVGSRQGWVEVPYAPCPAGLAQVAAGIVTVPFRAQVRVRIVPGLRSSAGPGDVMRGEETQLLGVLDALPAQALVCLPGTHSKWAQVVDGRILAFDTHMTGEVFALLRQHSLLGRMMDDAVPQREPFLQGVHRARERGGLLHHLFGVRARGLLGELAPAHAAAYLSGILIGHELAGRPALTGPVYLLGSDALCTLYHWALEEEGLDARRLPADAVARGLYRLEQLG